MKTNSLLTYLLYALLATLLIAAGYKACQMQKEKQTKAQAEKEWQETLHKLYPDKDSTGGGSAYIGNDQTAPSSNPAVSKNGIEDEPATSGKTPANTITTTTTTTKTTTPAAQNPATTTTAKPKVTTPKTTAKGAVNAGSGRWEVRAGTFTYKDGARDRLEQVIKMGYTNAEIGTTAGGKYAVVVVLRTNDKAKAIQVGDQLEKRGIDAFVHDRNKKN